MASFKVPFVNYPLQYHSLEKELDSAIKDVLKRGDLVLRSDVESFEKNLAEFCGTKYAVGVNSGTDALILSLRAAGVGPGDEVITVSHTFMASIACIAHVGATPVLIDVREDFNMDVEKLEAAITDKTKAIIPVHLNGRVCEMDKLMDIANRHNLIVVEDSAQALGAKFSGQKAGSFGKTGCFSFYPAKILGALGDAGAVTTNDEQMNEKLRLLRGHGQKTKTEFVMFGFTSRLANLQAAILNVKIKYIPKWIERRREIAKIYNEGLKDVKNIHLPPAPGSDSRFFDVFQNYVLRAEKRNELFDFLKEKGVETLIKDPVANHKHPNLGLDNFSLPVSERLPDEVISLPMYPELTDEQVGFAAQSVKDFYQS